MHPRARALLVGAVALASLFVASPAHAGYDTTDPGVTVDDTKPAQGEQIHVEACCFKPFSLVDIVVNSTPRLLAQVQADAVGRVSADVVLPADLPVGNHTIVVSGVDVNDAQVSFQLPIEVAPQQTAGGSLPRTGAAIGAMVGAGLVLIFTGAVLTRIRRTNASPA